MDPVPNALALAVVGVLTAAVLQVAVGASPRSAQDAGKSVNDGVYSEAQAERGRKVFEAKCGICHDTGRFTGDEFIKHWSGQPLNALFDTMRTTMPEDNPGSLPAQQYADLVSYLLQLNKFPTGPDELEAAEDAMRGVRMEAPKPGPRREP
jgi:mono/diheme cytochrome c family protein